MKQGFGQVSMLGRWPWSGIPLYIHKFCYGKQWTVIAGMSCWPIQFPFESTWNPVVQLHWKELSVLVQSCWQLCTPSWHSSISEQNRETDTEENW